MKRLTALTLIIIIVTANPVFPQGNPPGDDFTPEKISSFTCSLIENREYYRAYVELLRLNSFYSSYISRSEFDITSRYIFYKSKKYRDIAKTGVAGIQDNVYIPAGLFFIDSLIKLDRIKEAETELDRIRSTKGADDYSPYIEKRSIYLSLIDERSDKKRYIDDYPGYRDLYLYSERMHESRKTPWIGAVSGIIPGMGFVYAGEPGTGFVSLFVIGACSAVTYMSYREGLNSLAAVTGLITFFFYGGSIAGGYMQSERYNSRIYDTMRSRLDNDLLPERDLDEIYLKFGLKCR